MANKVVNVRRQMKIENMKEKALIVMGYAFLFSLLMVLGLIALTALSSFFLQKFDFSFFNQYIANLFFSLVLENVDLTTKAIFANC